MNITQKNLIKTFLMESKNMNLFDYFSSQAKKEGFIKIQKLFEEFSGYERSHAKNILRLINSTEISVDFDYDHIPIDKTVENIKNIITELEKIIYMYDDFIEASNEENENIISVKLNSLKKAHEYKLIELRKVLSELKNDKLFVSNEDVFWKCMKCGYITEGKKPPETCPACGHPKGYFEKISL